MNVKSRIASYEVRNEELRRTGPSTTKHSGQLSPSHHLSSPGGSSVPSSTAPSDQSSSDEGDDRARSNTSVASQNRIHRLRNRTTTGDPNMNRKENNNNGIHNPNNGIHNPQLHTKNEMRARRLMGVPATSYTKDPASTKSSASSVNSGSTKGQRRNVGDPPQVSLFAHPRNGNTGKRNMGTQKVYQHPHPHPQKQRNTSEKRVGTALAYRPGVKPRRAMSSSTATTMTATSSGSATTTSGFSGIDDSMSMSSPGGDRRNPTSNRLAKIQRIQKNRTMERARRANHTPMIAAPALPSVDSKSTITTELSPRKMSPTATPTLLGGPSGMNSADDEEMTLTSVRQILGSTNSVSHSQASNHPVDEDPPLMPLPSDDKDLQYQDDSFDEYYGGRSEGGHYRSDHANYHGASIQKNPSHQRSAHLRRRSSKGSKGSSKGSRSSRGSRGSRSRGEHMSASGGEEKSDKQNAMRRRSSSHKRNDARIVVSRSSSSEDETDGDPQPDRPNQRPQRSQEAPDVASYFEQSQKRRHSRYAKNPGMPTADKEDDEEDAGSQESMSYSQRQKRARERRAREEAVAKAKAGLEGFVSSGDVEHLQSLNTPIAQTAVGVATAATIGCLVIGPVGLLVGAAAVGIGVGVMQIPEEQRDNMNAKATKALRGVSDRAFRASETLSHTCASTYQESGLAEHVTFCNVGEESQEANSITGGAHHEDLPSSNSRDEEVDRRAELSHSTKKTAMTRETPRSQKNVACLREGKIIPVSQIYSLSPEQQPRAWLDVLASAETSHDEKMEAMEEILILAKDKTRARLLVEEGILDSIMWTLNRYFEKLQSDDSTAWAHPTVTRQETKAATLAAACCLRLGKAYCAAMHTDGDLMLMSLYERGTVPEDRQLAQMLHEVPFHVRITKTNDPSVVDPDNEVFALTQMTLPHAEEFSRAVKALADGKHPFDQRKSVA